MVYAKNLDGVGIRTKISRGLQVVTETARSRAKKWSYACSGYVQPFLERNIFSFLLPPPCLRLFPNRAALTAGAKSRMQGSKSRSTCRSSNRITRSTPLRSRRVRAMRAGLCCQEARPLARLFGSKSTRDRENRSILKNCAFKRFDP